MITSHMQTSLEILFPTYLHSDDSKCEGGNVYDYLQHTREQGSCQDDQGWIKKTQGLN